MPWSLREANLHSPEAIQNRIVRQINQMDGSAQLVTADVFPMVELSDSRETYFTQDGLRIGMRQTSLASESPVGDIESLGEQDVTVETFKKKMAPEKGVDTELNSQQEILNLFNATADALMEDVLLTRAQMAWRGLGDVDGMIGQEGLTAHPDIPSDHVNTPSTAYSDHANSTPLGDFLDAELQVNEDGGALSQAGPLTAYVSPSVLFDLKQNDELSSKYRNIAALSDDQVADALQIDNIRTIRTKVVRRNANGEPIDSSGNVVEDPANAARDNILEPWDPSASTNRRNVVIGAAGQVSAFMPWFLDRLAERGSAAPSGEVSIDATNGWLTQTWTENDPLVTWFKVAQEVGFHVTRGGNWYIIQDI